MWLCVSVVSASAGKQEKRTWKDRTGHLRSRASLDVVLNQHALWLQSKEESGSQADLSDADLSYANLFGAMLDSANLDGADLSYAILDSANLRGADLFFADLCEAQLEGAVLNMADLSYSDLRRARLNSANLSGADLSHSNLQGANLRRADLREADLRGADLSETLFSTTVVAGAIFEPSRLPPVDEMASAKELWLMRYVDNPGPLAQLRKNFQDDGFRTQERDITYALNHHDADPSALRASIVEKWNSIRGKESERGKILPFRSFIESAFKGVAFDLTCQYGMSYGRPLRIVGLLWLLFAAVYAVFIHWPGSSGLYFVGTRVWRGKSNTQAIQIRSEPLPAAKWWKVPFLWLKREWRVWRAAMFFSLMSAFNIGFRDINFGRWLRLLTKREYDLKAVGWARTASGFQSLLSVYLIALWVLTYFGRPFG
jgi:hypothetical protein